jgi:hypothetical protein
VNPRSFQYIDASIHGVALGDAAQIDAHPLLRELHGLILGIEQHVPIVDRRQRLGDLRLVRMHVLAKVVHVADAGVGNVEGAVGDDRILLGRGQQIEQFLADPHGAVRGLGIDLGDLAGRLVRAHRLVDVPHFIEQASIAWLALAFVVRPQFHGDPRAHDAVGDAPHPLGVRRRGQTRQRQTGGAFQHRFSWGRSLAGSAQA